MGEDFIPAAKHATDRSLWGMGNEESQIFVPDYTSYGYTSNEVHDQLHSNQADAFGNKAYNRFNTGQKFHELALGRSEGDQSFNDRVALRRIQRVHPTRERTPEIFIPNYRKSVFFDSNFNHRDEIPLGYGPKQKLKKRSQFDSAGNMMETQVRTTIVKENFNVYSFIFICFLLLTFIVIKLRYLTIYDFKTENHPLLRTEIL